MKITKLPIYRDDRSYMFEPFTGLLLERICDDKLNIEPKLSKKVCVSLNLNENPYNLQNHKEFKTIAIKTSRITTRLYVKLLIKMCKASFLLTRILTLFKISIYENATEAIIAFREIAPLSIQNDLCLPRALYAAVTSKKFKEKGVLFIGVFLPSKSMHAWIIEDGIQPDPYDAMWINFQPVAAIW
jgi:hypothetical protein